MKKKYLHLIVFFIIIAGRIIAQSAIMPRPIYSNPYTIPDKSEIENSLNSIKNYFYSITPYKIINEKTGEEIIDFSCVDQDAAIDTRVGRYNLWVYEMGVVYTGMFYAAEVLNDESFMNYPIKNYNFIFDHLPYFRKKAAKFGISDNGLKRIINMNELDDCGSIGSSLILAYYKKPDKRYKEMIDIVEDYIMNKQFRLDNGTYARKKPQENTLWTDDIYMCVPFLVRMGELTKDSKYFDEAIKQVLQFSEKLFVYEKNLFDHGISLNNLNDPHFFWARANGWAMVAMTELLSLLPENYKDHEKVLKILRQQIKGVSEYQDGSGMWHNLIDKEDTFLESSSTAMFTYCISKAVNEGWVDHTYGAVALTGWNALKTNILPNGQIKNVCIGTGFSDDIVYYYHRPTSMFALHGYGPTLMAGSEIIKLIKNENLNIDRENDSFRFTIKKKNIFE